MANNGYNRNYNRNYNRSYTTSSGRPGASGRRPVTSGRRPVRRRRNRKRIRNRIIIVSTMLIMLILLITIITLMFKSCFGGNDKETMSTETLSSTINNQPTTSPAGGGKADVSSYAKPKPEDDGSGGEFEGGLFIWNKAAFELFYGSEDSAAAYANAVNGYADKLGDGIKTYSMVVPNHTEMGLPERFKNGDVSTSSQAENIATIYSKFNSNVTAVNCYNTLAEHCNEYIYFNSDHHWTGLGAYYAYTDFAKEDGQEPLLLENCDEKTIDGFTGSFTKVVTSELKTDSVHYWEFPYSATMDMTSKSTGENASYDSVYYEGASAGGNTYGVFIFGDNPLSVLKSDRNTGQKIAVVKESYGNAFVPYLTYNYDEVHVIDFRHWEGNLPEYCKDNDIDSVLFINGIMSANTAIQIKAMDSLF